MFNPLGSTIVGDRSRVSRSKSVAGSWSDLASEYATWKGTRGTRSSRFARSRRLVAMPCGLFGAREEKWAASGDGSKESAVGIDVDGSESAGSLGRVVRLRRKGMRSWFDVQWGPLFKLFLSRRLIARCKGERGVFLTLTYDRDAYDSACDLYDRAQRERHVREFMRRLSRALGESVKGKWICKLEFQEGGWVHWHILLLGRAWLKYETLRDAWGRGHVWVEKMTTRRIKYICKYVSKDGTLPTFLMFRPSRSVRVVRVSPGFWGEPRRRGVSGPDDPAAPGEPISVSQWMRLADRVIRRVPFFRSLGASLERGENETLVADGKRYRSVRGRVATLIRRCVDWGGVIVSSDGRWVGVELGSGRGGRLPRIEDVSDRGEVTYLDVMKSVVVP